MMVRKFDQQLSSCNDLRLFLKTFEVQGTGNLALSYSWYRPIHTFATESESDTDQTSKKIDTFTSAFAQYTSLRQVLYLHWRIQWGWGAREAAQFLSILSLYTKNVEKTYHPQFHDRHPPPPPRTIFLSEPE